MHDSEDVFFFAEEDPHPIFHRRQGDTVDMPGDWELYTLCGRLVFKDSTGGWRWSVTRLRLDHARYFGRPCKTCWPSPNERPRPIPITTHLAWRSVAA